jgi:predicted S18 family serine protease
MDKPSATARGGPALNWWPSSPRGFAVATLAASEQLETDQLDNFVIVGELAPTGSVGPVGNLPLHHSPSKISGFPAF